MSWGPWLDCDGAGLPQGVPDGTFDAQASMAGPGLWPSGSTARDWPGLFWRWRRVRAGWFSTRMVRVCDDPAYAPIIALRIRQPDAMAQLVALAANPKAVPIFSPEKVGHDA